MSAIVQAVRFGNLADQLNEAEFIKFLEETLRKLGRMFVLGAFIQKSMEAHESNDDDDGAIAQMIEIINSLIRKREHSADNAPSQSVSMSSLAAPLIGNIASYLRQKDHVRFALVSRNNYIGCNSPSSLRDLNLIKYADDSPIDIQRFCQLHSLRLSIRKMNLLFMPLSGYLCRHLTKLELNNGCNSILDVDLKQFMQLQSINFTQITHLILRNFSTPSQRISPPHLLKLLSFFPNLQYLHLDRVHVLPFQPVQLIKLKELLKNLEVFVARGKLQTLSKQIISVIPKQLKAFRGAINFFGNGCDAVLDGLSSSALEEISIAPQIGCSSALEKIRRNGSMLKRVSLDWLLCRGADQSSPSSLIPHLISRGSQLEQLVIGAKLRQLNDVCTAIIEGIRGIAEERYGLQIKLWIDGAHYDAEGVINCVYNVVDRLLSSPNIQHFVFIWRFWSFKNKKQYLQWNQAIELILQRGNSFNVSYDARNIMITNKSCQLEGQIQNYMTDDWMTSEF